MKTTSQQCFKTPNHLCAWQSNNCDRCKKAVFYNQRLNRMPAYRCAVQRQIEDQQLGEMEINQRTFDAVQSTTCQFFVARVEEPEVLDFSKGESLVKKDVLKEPANEFANGNANEVQTKTKAQPKTEPTTIEELVKGGYPVQVMLPEMYRQHQMDLWTKGRPMMHDIHEKAFKDEVKDGVREMLDAFTWNENMQIAFVPLIISKIAWWYAEKAMQYCVDNRISVTKKLSRAIKEMRIRYVDELKKDLDLRHINHVERQALQFIEECKKDFLIFELQVSQAIKTEYPTMPDEMLRKDALCGIMMVEFLKRHNGMMDKIIAAKMGQSTSITSPHMVALETLLDAYMPEGFKIKNTRQIDLCLNVLENRVRAIDFQVVG